MRKLCPKCQGGRSRELSLSSVERDGVLAWRCWRAKCGYRTLQLASDAPPKPEPARRYPPSILPLTLEACDYLWNKYHISQGVAQAYGVQSASYGRLALPIYSPRGLLRGWNIRGTREGQSKASIYCTGDLTLAWFKAWDTRTHDGPVIAVEDQLSAIRIAAAGLTACALLGTNVSAAKVAEIDKISHGHWLLALDADACSKALVQTQRHDIKMLRLSRDAKNCNPSELERYVVQRAINATRRSN